MWLKKWIVWQLYYTVKITPYNVNRSSYLNNWGLKPAVQWDPVQSRYYAICSETNIE